MPEVTLTFDNGPTPGVTERVLEVLEERGLRATFFVIGNKVLQPGGRELAEHARSQGHWIGNHTMSHGDPLGLLADPDRALAEITDTQKVLGDLAEPQRLFRPTGHGSVGPHLLSVETADFLKANEFTVALWTLFVRDSKVPVGWVDRALERLPENENHVLVVHDLPTGAMDELPRFLDSAEARGYTFVQEFPLASTPMRLGRTDPGFDTSFVQPPRSETGVH
ncbi:polysaccharide deacetylase family protein [Rhodococcoides fascians]|uniref:polysaccharide deacetylase family protein n=1 Tax=Rhodococcoides fascians TaxID=1828 RepID=UPI0037944AF1